MTNEPLDQDQMNIQALADRAAKLVDRRTMLVSTARIIALPVLLTHVVSREAMAMTGSTNGKRTKGTKGTKDGKK